MKLHKFAVLFILLTALFSFPSFVSSNSVTENNSPNDGDWQQLNPANAPDARFGHSLVTMPDGRGILFGGEHQPGELFDDLHIFEQDQWSMVTPVGDSPPARRAHSRWVRGDIMFIYGGKNADGLLAELYSYSPDAKQWSLIVPNNDPPAARYGAQSWEYDDLLYMMGGKDENDLDCEEVFVFNPDTGEWETKMSQINAFPVSSLNVVGVHQDTAYILGSSDEVIVKYDLPNNTMELDYPNGTTPEARLGSAFTQSETTAWLFGGKDGSTVMGDAYAFDFATETYTRLPDMPFALYQAAAAFDGNEVVVYGGVKADGSLNDTTFLLTVVNTNWSPGSKDTGFANVSANGTIKDVARQHDGKYIVVGDFTQVNGVTRNRIARFHSDGSLDTSFNPPDTPNDIVNAVAIAPDGKIIIGGKFNQVGSSSELQNLAMFNPDGSIDPDFHPPIQEKTDATINDIDILNEKTILGADSYSIYVGGNLTYNISHLNYSISQIAHLHNRGWLHNSLKNDDNGVEIDGVVNVIDAAKDIGVLIGGDFTHVNGEGRNGMAHLFFDGTLSSNFATGTGANGAVNDMAQLSNGKTIVVGDFTQYDSNPRNGIVKLDANGLLDLLWNPGNGANGSIRTVSVNEKGEIFVGGDFTVYNGQTATRIAKLDTNGVLDDIFSAFGGANGTVNDVLVQGNGQIAVAGDFTQLGGWTTDHFGRLNQDGSPDTGFDTSTGANNSIYDIASAPDGKLYIGGRFTSVQGVSCPKIARLNADGTVDTTFNPGLGPDDDVEALAVQPNGQVIAVGMFENVGTEAYHGYARYNTDGHLDTNWGFGSAGANFAVYDVLPQPDGKTLLAGWFTSLNGHSANFIGLLGASGYYDPSFNSGTGFNDAVYTLEQAPNGNVFVGGRFTSYNSLSAGRIVSITPNGTRDASFFTGTGFNSNVWAFANAPDGKLYVGGDFSSFNGTPANRITRHNSDGSLDTTFDVGTGPNSRVSFLSTHADKLYVGGSFTEFNGEPHYRFVRLNADGSVDDNFDIGAGANNGVLAGVVQPDDNKVVMVGNFTQFDNQPANYLTRLNGATMPSFTNEPPDLTVNLGDAVNSPLAATGIPSPTFGIVPSGTVGTESTPTQILTTTNGLPPGLTLSESGVISGTATTAGIYTFTVRVSNYVAPSAYQTMTISIVEAGENKIYLPLVTK